MLPRTRMKKMRGFSLVEMLIAMGIAIIILVVVSASYLSGLGTQHFQTEVIRVQESGRFAFDLIGRSIRRSGYRNTYLPYPTTYNYSSMAREFCSTGAVSNAQFQGLNDPASFDPTAGDLTGKAVDILNKSDVLKISGYGEDNAAGTAADGGVIDCLGNAIRRGELREEILYVAKDSDNNDEPALFCRSSKDNKSVAMIPGVESMQMLFGEDTDNDGIINRYVSIDKVDNPDNVFEVMVSIVSRGGEPSKALEVIQPYEFNQLGTKVTLPTSTTTDKDADKRVRREFTTTIAFRNYRQC